MSRRVLRGFDREEFKRQRQAWRGTGMSKHDLGRLAEATLRSWENGTRAPNIDKLVTVLAVLEIPISEVVVIPPEKRALGDLRVLAGHTQPQLAKAVGMSTTALSMLERGGTPLTDQRAQALAPLLSVSPEEIHAAWLRAKNRPPGTPA